MYQSSPRLLVEVIDRSDYVPSKGTFQNPWKIMADYPEIFKCLRQHLGSENLLALSSRLEEIQIEKHLSLPFHSGEQGYYLARDQKIVFRENEALPHEILHALSRDLTKKEDVLLVGFEQRGKKTRIGVGLNDGYTALLTSRLFGFPLIYKEAAYIATLLECFFSCPEEMESCYFNHDLPSLVKKLEPYASREEILSFFSYYDMLMEAKDKETLKAALEKYLIKWYQAVPATHPQYKTFYWRLSQKTISPQDCSEKRR